MRLQDWYRNNNASRPRWYQREIFASGISPAAGSIPALIQSNFGTQGDFELVFRDVGSRLQHWSRNNDAPNSIWSYRATFAENAEYRPALIQSNFGNKGHFEVVRKIIGGPLEHWSRLNDDPILPPWAQGLTFGSNNSLP